MTAPLPPRAGAPAMVPVNTRPLAVSSVSAPGTFTFRKDSAGLGVPRDFGELRSISSDVVHHGQVNTEIERSSIGPSAAFAANRNANGNGNRNVNGHVENVNRGSSSAREYTPGSRSVGTFTRTDMRANGMDEMNGMNRPMNNGMNNAATQGSSMSAATPNHSWMRPEASPGSGGTQSRGAGAPSANAAPASGGAPAAHK